MRAGLTHDFREEREAILEQESRVSLAIVDLESYPTYLSAQADHLDLLQHLCAQNEALTAAMWEVPAMPLRLRIVQTHDHRDSEEMSRTGHYVVATGRVRCYGRLCLASQEQLLDCARHRNHKLDRRCRAADARCPHLLLVPSGVYSGSVPVNHGGPPHNPAAPDYVVVLRHYPHPGPRLQPVRLGSLIPWAGADAAVNARPFGL
jgi:hypothetical protein